MQRRFGLSAVKCRFCSYKTESSIHPFKDCWWLKALWSGSGLNELHLNIPFSCFADWIFYLSRNLDHKDFQLAVCTFWYFWFNKNLRWHGEDGMEILDTSMKIKLFTRRFKFRHSY